MEPSTANTNFCPNCGSPLGQNVNYCSQCGTQCRVVAPPDTESENSSSTDSSESDDRDDALLAFRRRVQARLVDGWDLEHDHGDSVVLVDRGIGKLWIHAPLLVFTGGVGNLVYGWYSHSYNANRILMQADGTYYAGDNIDIKDFREEKGDSVGSYLLGSLLLLFAVGAIASASLVPIVFGLLALTGALWALPPTRRRLNNRHPVTRFGAVRSTDEETVTDPSTPCVVCASPVEEGIERTYREEYVFAGVPLFTTETGENHYCRECAGSDINDTGIGPVESDDPTTKEGTPEME